MACRPRERRQPLHVVILHAPRAARIVIARVIPERQPDRSTGDLSMTHSVAVRKPGGSHPRRLSEGPMTRRHSRPRERLEGAESVGNPFLSDGMANWRSRTGSPQAWRCSPARPQHGFPTEQWPRPEGSVAMGKHVSSCGSQERSPTLVQALMSSGRRMMPFAATVSALSRSSSVSIPISSSLASPALRISGSRLLTVAAA